MLNRSVLTVLVAALIGVMFTADAMGMMHPRLGRFMQQDPHGQQIGLYHTSEGFIARDSIEPGRQYADGMNLHAAHYAMSSMVDPYGLNEWPTWLPRDISREDLKKLIKNTKDWKRKAELRKAQKIIDQSPRLNDKNPKRSGRGGGRIRGCVTLSVLRVVPIATATVVSLSPSSANGVKWNKKCESVGKNEEGQCEYFCTDTRYHWKRNFIQAFVGGGKWVPSYYEWRIEVHGVEDCEDCECPPGYDWTGS